MATEAAEKSPLIHAYAPFLHQVEKHNSQARIKVDVSPARSGKDVCMINDMVEYTCRNMEEWQARPREMSPKWHVWFLSPTYKLGDQLWRDTLNYLPRELMDGDPKQHEKKIPLINDGQIQFRSADNPDWLVASPVDFLGVTEAALCKKGTWPLARVRLSSPDRFHLSRAYLNSTPQGQIDPEDPEALQWLWAMCLHGRQENPEGIQSWYWYEDRARYGYLEHPILSLTPDGRRELDLARNDPDMPERDFRQNYLGECLPAVMGRAIIRDFMPELFVQDTVANRRYNFYRVWDFGRLYPSCTFHQVTPDNIWDWHGEFCPILQDVTDEEFVEQALMYMRREFPDIPEDKAYDIGDYEATNKEDSRKKTTAQMMKDEFGIKLITPPKKHGDDKVAINSLQGRVKVRDDGKPMIRINPRATLTIKCFEGMWLYEKKKTGNVEWYAENVAEIHPWIDIFDTAKYFIVQVLGRQRVSRKPRIPARQRYNPITGRPE